MRRLVLLCSFLIATVTGAKAQVNAGENGRLSGLVYGDYYWMASNHNESLEGNNGFWFRRIYLTYDRTLNNAFSSRLRIEMNSEGNFLTNATMIPIVKDAYLKWENDQHEVIAGISPVPTFGLVEDIWGYRSVEKTPLDLQGFASSRDFGVAAKGTIGDDERWNYHAMIGNGHGNNGSEINTGKKLMLAVSYQLTEQWIVEIYGDRNSLAGEEYHTTVQGFAGYRTDNLNFGALFAHQFRNLPGPAGNSSLDIVSLFARTSVSDVSSVFFRIDHLFDPNPDGGEISYLPFSNNAESTLLIGGIDISLESDIHLIPNFEAVVYGETPQGDTPGTDLMPRLTLFYQF